MLAIVAVLTLAVVEQQVGLALNDKNYVEPLTGVGDVWLVYFHGSKHAGGCRGCGAFETAVGSALFRKLKKVRVGHVDVGDGAASQLLALAGDDALRTPSVALYAGGAPSFMLTAPEAEDVSAKALAKRIKRALSALSTDGATGRFQKGGTEALKEATLSTAKHILVKTRAEIEGLLAQLTAKTATFEELAAKHSNCPSGKKGGSLGQFGRGQMVKEFEQPAFYGELNEVLGPIETKFGWHLLIVTARE